MVYWSSGRIPYRMKYFALSLALAGAISAAEFRTGQAARAVVGQDSFTRQRAGASAALLGAVSGVAYGNDTLVVSDSTRIPAFPQNQRVLVYRGISQQIPDRKVSSHNWELRCPVCQAEAQAVIGQPDFEKTAIGLAQNRLRTPTGVATDGQRLAVADTDNNRVLIWNAIPSTNEAPADLVIGQKDFNTGVINSGGSGNSPSAQGLRGPQGVWIQGNRLLVADTQNHRILVWNNFPTQNGQAADLVLGAPDFTTFVQPDLVQLPVSASPKSLLNPVAVNSDGVRLIVTDLGHNRVVIWNSFPTQNNQPADFVLGQPDITSTAAMNASDPNNSRFLCPATGKDADGNDTFPYACAATLSFPRFALSDGTRLFIADGGNDRVLVYHTMPNRSGQPADAILGQPDENISSDSDEFRIAAADTLRTPSGLAWDGTNLYVTDPYNRRVMVFSMGEDTLPLASVRNAASREIFANGNVTFTADPKENDEITIRIASREYKYKAIKDDKVGNVVSALVQLINANAGDPDVIATGNPLFGQILLNARAPGDVGNQVTIAATFSTGSQIQATVSGGTLSGGKDTAKVAPGTLVSIIGENLADVVATASLQGNDLPHTLGGVEVYVDGLSAPLLYVSPTQINTQLPFEVNEASSVSLWVRKQDANGNVRVTNAIGVPVVPQNPGIFAFEGSDPREAVAFHGSSSAVGVVSVDGTPKENDVVSIMFGEEGAEDEKTYSYTVLKDDTLAKIRDGLIAAINGAEDSRVVASPGGVFNRVFLQSRVPGSDGEGLRYRTKSTEQIFLTPYGERLCCSSQGGAPITADNPARPGELITVYATGLGLVLPTDAKFFAITGSTYRGPEFNYTNVPVDDAIAGGKTANVIFAGLKQGAIGVYEVKLLLNSDIPTNAQTELIIAQQIYVSNIVTFPVVNPNVVE